MKKIKEKINRITIATTIILLAIKLFIIFALPINVLAESIEYTQIKDIRLNDYFKINQDCSVKAFQGTENAQIEDSVPARLCFCKGKSDECFEAKSFTSTGTRNFQFVKKLSITPLFKSKEPHNAVLFIAENHTEGGSGYLRLITLWTYSILDKKFVNLLPLIQITEQGEYRLLTAKEGIEGLFVTADYIWGENETHFSPHRYKINIYFFNDGKKSYNLRKEYITKSKYKSLDDVERINVIMPELNKIKELLNK